MARSLYTTSESTGRICPLVNGLMQMECSSLLKFNDEEKKSIDESKDSFATIAGVHRQAACVFLQLMRAMVEQVANKPE